MLCFFNTTRVVSYSTRTFKNNPGNPENNLDCKTVGFFLKISKEIGKAWRKSLARAARASHLLFDCSLVLEYAKIRTVLSVLQSKNNDDVLAPHSVATLARHCFEWSQHCSNIATLCCAKNRRCESSRATSP